MISYYENRELSWLKFNKRVLMQSQAHEVPLFERMKFIEIFGSNLDEFFMVRVGSMYDRSLLPDDPPDGKTGMTASEQLEKMYSETRPLYALRDNCYRNLTSALAEKGVKFIGAGALKGDTARVARQYFKREVLPYVTPLILDAKHPLPMLENLKPYLVVSIRPKKDGGKATIGLVAISNAFGSIISLPSPKAPSSKEPSSDGMTFVPVEDLMLRFASDIFKNYDIFGRTIVRVTRNADVTVEDNFADDEVDYRDYVTAIIKRREKMTPVRLETYSASYAGAEKIAYAIAPMIGLDESKYFHSMSVLDLGSVYGLESKIRRNFGDDTVLFHAPLSPRDQPDVPDDRTIEETAQHHDIFLSFPYYSMKPYLRMLDEAVSDPETESIKISLYRMAANSLVIDALSRAARSGIEVIAVVELKARFDENNNVNWSRRLEDAGCHVHVGTGNYNEKTAKLYTDVGIITADERIAGDAELVFDNIMKGIPGESYDYLLVAPHTLRQTMLREIETEASYGQEGYICMKMNSLTDKAIIDALADASSRGVKIDLIVRGICCLLPGIIGVTDNIRVVSIVGRFLEHSRLFIFGNGRNVSRRVYLGSADMMTRNTTRRVEVITPVYDKAIADRIFEMTRVMLADNVKRSRLMSNGRYERVITGKEPLDSQEYFYAEAYRATEKKDEE
jgi:polyphosphate kinase